MESRSVGSASTFLSSQTLAYRCHLGKSSLYDTVSNLSWAVDLRLHGIVVVVEQILKEPWPASEELGREVPEAKVQEDCVVRQPSHLVSDRYTDRSFLISRSAIVGNMATSRNNGQL
jgi:hypothetical protein